MNSGSSHSRPQKAPEPAALHVAHAARPRKGTREPGAAGLLGALFAVEAVLFGIIALWPPSGIPQAINPVSASVCAVLALFSMVVGKHLGNRALEGLTVLAWIVPLVAVATRLMESSQVLWGGPLILAAVFVAFIYSSGRALLHVALMCIGYAIAASVLGVHTRPLYVSAVLVCAVVSALAVGWMRRQRNEAIAAWAQIAVRDHLTELLNRRGLEVEAPVVRANAARLGQQTVVAVIDLDGLKEYNDTKGHEAGDELLQAVARQWRDGARKGDLIARIGGDEFVFVLPQTDEATAAHMLDRMRRRALTRWSHGITAWTTDESLDSALRRADELMYREKSERSDNRQAAAELLDGQHSRFPEARPKGFEPLTF